MGVFEVGADDADELVGGLDDFAAAAHDVADVLDAAVARHADEAAGHGLGERYGFVANGERATRVRVAAEIAVRDQVGVGKAAAVLYAIVRLSGFSHAFAVG